MYATTICKIFLPIGNKSRQYNPGKFEEKKAFSLLSPSGFHY
jgi:hypothetical protein